MPDLALNYEQTPPWLAENKDNSAFENVLNGVQAGQRSRQLNMQEAQVLSQIKTAQQDQQMNTLKMNETIRQRDQMLEAEMAAQSLPDSIAPLLESGQPQKAMDALLSAGVRKPILFKSPQWQTMVKEVQAAVTTETARLQLESQEKLRRSMILENEAQAEAALAKSTDAWLNDTPGFTTTKLDSGHLIIQDTQKGGIHIVDPTKKSVAAHLAAFRSEDSALQKQLTGIENDLMMKVNPAKKSEAIARIQAQRAEAREKYLGRMLQEEGSQTVPALTPIVPVVPATPTIDQDKATILNDAREAIKIGKSRDRVIKRLRELGITEEP